MQEIKKINLSLEWNEVKLEDVGKIITGKTPKTSIEDNYGGHIPFLTPSDDMNVKIIKYTNKTLTLKGLNEVKNCLIPKNSVCVSCIGSDLGKVVLTSEDTVTNQQINSIIVNEKFDYNFIYYTMILLGKQLNYMSKSSTAVPIINKSTFSNELIFVPSLEEQKKISSILSNIDAKIDNLDKINKNLEELAKAIYRHHFIDFKPYALGGLMKHFSQGMIPKDWSVQSIEEFVDDMKNGGTPKRGESDYWDNGTVPWLKTGEINNNIIIKSEEHITELGLKNSSAKLLPINSIIMALYGKGTAARIGLLKFEATTNQACCAMICNDFNKTLFLYLFLLFNQKEIENLASGSVQQNLSKDLIANLELVVPPIEIIDNLPFKKIFDTIANNYFEIEYLTNLRDTLLPKLMSGEIDVSKINCDLELKYNYMKYLFNQIHTPMSKSVV